MIWLGIIIGFFTGVVVVSLVCMVIVSELREQVTGFQQMAIRDKELIDEAIKTLRCYETQNGILRQDVKVLQGMLWPTHTQIYGASYRSHHEQ